MAVMIGVDPHKGSHTAVAIDGDEAALAAVKVRGDAPSGRAVARWAARFEERTWAIESAGGLGLSARPATRRGRRDGVGRAGNLGGPGAGVGSGPSNKNDPNDALSVAVAALRAPRLARCERDDLGGVASVGQAQRRSGPGPQPGRVPAPRPVGRARSGRDRQARSTSLQRRSGAGQGRAGRARWTGPGTGWRSSISRICVASTSRSGPPRSASPAAVTASGTTVTELFGVGPVVAAW